jgi:hypothetical protein
MVNRHDTTNRRRAGMAKTRTRLSAHFDRELPRSCSRQRIPLRSGFAFGSKGSKSLPPHDGPLDLIRSAHDRSAIRPSTTCSVGTARAIDGSSVVGVFANDRSPMGSSTARSIHAIGANHCIRLIGHGEPAENDDDRERIFPHDCLPVGSLTMLSLIDTQQANRRWPSSLATRRTRHHWLTVSSDRHEAWNNQQKTRFATSLDQASACQTR